MRGRHNTDAHGPRVLGSALRLVLQGIVLVVGVAMIVASIALGWLPGPGGIPLFLAGVAVLSTQFEWAQRLRRWIFAKLKHAAGRARRRTVEVVDDITGELTRVD